MKKLLMTVLIAACVAGLKLTSFGQVLEAPPRDGVFDKSAIVEYTHLY